MTGVQTCALPIYRPLIQPNDILDIYVTSTSPEASKFFNYDANQSIQLAGFLVDKKGEVIMPIIGAVRVEGLNSSDARDTIAKKLAKYLVTPSVKLSIRNFKVTVLGEVLHVGVFTVPNEKITLPEALALAGDFTPFSHKDDVTIIRDSSGYKTFGHVDLTTRELFSSKYYNLHANDIVYVSPTKKKRFLGESFYRNIPLILSFITFGFTVVQIAKK